MSKEHDDPVGHFLHERGTHSFDCEKTIPANNVSCTCGLDRAIAIHEQERKVIEKAHLVVESASDERLDYLQEEIISLHRLIAGKR